MLHLRSLPSSSVAHEPIQLCDKRWVSPRHCKRSLSWCQSTVLRVFSPPWLQSPRADEDDEGQIFGEEAGAICFSHPRKFDATVDSNKVNTAHRHQACLLLKHGRPLPLERPRRALAFRRRAQQVDLAHGIPEPSVSLVTRISDVSFDSNARVLAPNCLGFEWEGLSALAFLHLHLAGCVTTLFCTIGVRFSFFSYCWANGMRTLACFGIVVLSSWAVRCSSTVQHTSRHSRTSRCSCVGSHTGAQDKLRICSQWEQESFIWFQLVFASRDTLHSSLVTLFYLTPRSTHRHLPWSGTHKTFSSLAQRYVSE